MTSTRLAFRASSHSRCLRPPRPAPRTRNSPPPQRPSSSSIRTETLPNGLRVYLLPIPGSPVVTTMVAYKVGSADEDKDQTGPVALPRTPAVQGHRQAHARATSTGSRSATAGANNAYTNEDMTVYHFDFAADRWKTALEIEADRMRNLRIDEKHEFQQEKGAVIAELKGNEDRPWDLEYKTILPLLFAKASPYSHPVIGEEQHVRGGDGGDHQAVLRPVVPPEQRRPGHRRRVRPGRGDGEDQEAVRPDPEGRTAAAEAGPADHRRAAEQVRKEFASKFDVPRLLIGFNTVAVGRPGRLRPRRDRGRPGERQDVAGCTRSWSRGSGSPGRSGRRTTPARTPAAIPAGSRSTSSCSRARTASQGRGTRLRGTRRSWPTEPVTEAELKRVRRSMLAAFVFAQESVHDLADLIARSVTLADLDYLTTYLDKVLAVTPATSSGSRRSTCDRTKAVVVWSVPEEEKKAGASRKRWRRRTP